MPRVPRIRTVLLVTNLVVLALPLCGLVAMRFYENELIRRTETELYAQGAFIRETYRVAVLDALRGQSADGDLDAVLSDFGVPAPPEALIDPYPEDDFEHIVASLSRRRGRIAPPAPRPTPGLPVDGISEVAGAFITPILDRGKNVTLAGIRVVDFNGTEVANTRGDQSRPSLRGWTEVERALQGEVVSQLRARVSDEPRPALASLSRGTRVRVFVAMPIIEGDRVLGAVVLSRTPLSLSKGLYNNRVPLMWAGFALLVVVLMLSRFTSTTIARPLHRLVEQAAQIARRAPGGTEPMRNPGTAETQLVSEAMARMGQELGDREDYIRAFATSVSHEFKTPLTSMRGAIELLQDHWETMTEEERARFFSVLESERSRLERLVRRVLELARADVARPGDGDSANVGTVAEGIAAREAAHGRALRLVLPDDEVSVAMGADVLDTVLAALVANARQHGGPDVEVAVAARPDRVTVTVSDDGPGVSDANSARIFESFFTTDREGGGTGVGLAIVRTLCVSHGGGVTLTRRDGRTAFVISLPPGEAPADTE